MKPTFAHAWRWETEEYYEKALVQEIEGYIGSALAGKVRTGDFDKASGMASQEVNGPLSPSWVGMCPFSSGRNGVPHGAGESHQDAATITW